MTTKLYLYLFGTQRNSGFALYLKVTAVAEILFTSLQNHLLEEVGLSE